MANKTFQGRIIQKHDTKANWDKATNFVPLKGEIIVYDDLKKIKIGDGATKVGSLAFINDLDTLAAIAKTGSYNDLKNKPTIPTKLSNLTDDVVNGKYLPLTGGTMTGNIDVSNNRIYNTKSLSFRDILNEDEFPLFSYTLSNAGRLDAEGARPEGEYTVVFDTQASDNPDAIIEHLRSEGWSMPITTLRNIANPSQSYDAANKKYVDDQVAANDHIVNRFTFTATAGQSTFTIPFDFEDSSALTLYYNGVMMKETDNYTVSGKVITLAGFTAEAGDYLTVMGIEGAAAIDFGEEATNAINQMNVAKSETITAINNIKSQASTEINTVKSNAITEINNLVATLPSDTTNLMFLNKINTMTANGKITMDSTYTPSANGDVATKQYVDNHVPDIDPPVGTSTNYAIYIGSTAPASGTTPLLWIDTTASTGTFKYRTSTTGTWKPVPVAWS